MRCSTYLVRYARGSELKYDAEGPWLTGSVMDSLVPPALEMPAWRIARTETLRLSPLAA